MKAIDLFDLYRCTPQQREAILRLCEAKPELTLEGFFFSVEVLMDEAGVETTDLGPWISLTIRRIKNGSDRTSR